MRKYYDIQLDNHTVESKELHGEEIVKAGRYLIAKILLEMGAATVDPLSPKNPLIFSAGPFAGTTFSNANRTSVGCKSPLTGGIKEANGGGTLSPGDRPISLRRLRQVPTTALSCATQASISSVRAVFGTSARRSHEWAIVQ